MPSSRARRSKHRLTIGVVPLSARDRTSVTRLSIPACRCLIPRRARLAPCRPVRTARTSINSLTHGRPSDRRYATTGVPGTQIADHRRLAAAQDTEDGGGDGLIRLADPAPAQDREMALPSPPYSTLAAGPA